MKISAEDLLGFGICDTVIAEPEGGAAQDIGFTAANIAAWLHGTLDKLAGEDGAELSEKRYQKFRKIGVFRY
jgi:acetyl-CoA carboxylase carboxyl transferase subunit alpha